MDQYLYFPIHLSHIEHLSQFTELIEHYKQDLKIVLPKNITLNFSILDKILLAIERDIRCSPKYSSAK